MPGPSTGTGRHRHGGTLGRRETTQQLGSGSGAGVQRKGLRQVRAKRGDREGVKLLTE